MDQALIVEQLNDLFRSQLFGVLATEGPDGPYTSLVVFSATDDLRRLLFLTDRSTTKFENILASPRVSMMIDDRSNRDHDVRTARSVTVVGRTCEYQKESHGDLLRHFLAKHGNLEIFARERSTVLVGIEVSRYVLVRKFAEIVRWDPNR